MPNRQSIIPTLSDKDIVRFWSKVARSSEDDCWIWKDWKWKDRKGQETYGGFWLKGKDWPAHRIAYFLSTGFNSDSLFICHRCDNPPCCNPSHLFPDTPQGNMDDMARKGRRVTPVVPPDKLRRGESNNKSVLTEHQVLAMLRDRDRGMSGYAVGRKYGVDQGTARKIFQGQTWKHLYYPK